MTNSMKTPKEWQEWLKTICQEKFPELSWENGTETEPFIYGIFPNLEKDTYLKKMGLEVGLISNPVTGSITFSINLVPDSYDASEYDSYVFPLSRGRATIDEAVSEAQATLCSLVYALGAIFKPSNTSSK